MNILCLISDLSGCRIYRVRNPNTELRRHGVHPTEIAFLPNRPGTPQFNVLVEMFSHYDLVIVQRLYVLSMVKDIKAACEFLGIPMIFETDDNYLDLPPHNPAYFSIIPPEILRQPGLTKQQLMEYRHIGLEHYKEIISMADMVTVSTEELKWVLLPYNKNIKVFQNNVMETFRWRTWDPEEAFLIPDQPGRVIIDGGPQNTVETPEVNVLPHCEACFRPMDGPDNATSADIERRKLQNLGMLSVPSYYTNHEKQQLLATPRIGYSGTVSHQGPDWNTVKREWFRLVEKYSNFDGGTRGAWFVYIGDQFFLREHVDHMRSVNARKNKKIPSRSVHIGACEFDIYKLHLRNIDVGVCPIDTQETFNMSKSDIKAVELAAWGIPCVLPSGITYGRSFVHGETALFYDNSKEFYAHMETLINDTKLRNDMGMRALEYVENNRLEWLHAEERFNAYKELLDNSYRLRMFLPAKELEVA